MLYSVARANTSVPQCAIRLKQKKDINIRGIERIRCRVDVVSFDVYVVIWFEITLTFFISLQVDFFSFFRCVCMFVLCVYDICEYIWRCEYVKNRYPHSHRFMQKMLSKNRLHIYKYTYTQLLWLWKCWTNILWGRYSM